MLELTIYGIGFFLCTLLIQYMLFKVRKNHNHGPNGIWVGSRAILVLCVVGIINHKIAKKEINLKLRENDLLRKETLKKVKAGEISLDDLTLPVYETEEEKKERIEALEKLLLEEEGSNE